MRRQPLCTKTDCSAAVRAAEDEEQPALKPARPQPVSGRRAARAVGGHCPGEGVQLLLDAARWAVGAIRRACTPAPRVPRAVQVAGHRRPGSVHQALAAGRVLGRARRPIRLEHDDVAVLVDDHIQREEALATRADDARGVRKEHEEHGALDASPQLRLAEPQALRRLRDEARQPADEELVALFAVLLAVLLFEAAVDDGRADTSRRGRGVVRRVQLRRARTPWSAMCKEGSRVAINGEAAGSRTASA